MTRSLKKIALIVSYGTLASKAGGLLRQLVIAGVFGVGAAYDAYSYAYILPGFFLILLGGINGPFHNSIVSVLTKNSAKDNKYILTSINTLISTILLIISLLVFINADGIINIVGPGLSNEVHEIAVIQLKIMSPILILSGLLGIGFGALNYANEFLIPSISPVISSVSLILFIGLFCLAREIRSDSIQIEYIGGIVLGLGTSLGAFIQWIVQAPLLVKKDLIKASFSWDLRHPGVKKVLQLLGPATFSSGMLQINVFTDLFFASDILGAAAGLSYASFLIQAPLGLISNSLLIPLIPTFSRLAKNKDKEKLASKIRQGLMLSTSSMTCLGAIFIALSIPIVSIVYQRGAFESNAVNIVSSLLIAYGIGMPFYLGRDLLVRVFYALEDGGTPFRISTIGIILNIIFDWALVGGPSPWGHQLPFNFGAPGLVIATVLVNIVTCIFLILRLNHTINRLPIKEWAIETLKIFFAGISSGLLAWIISSFIFWPNNFIGQISELLLSAIPSFTLFIFIGICFRIKEIEELTLIFKKSINSL